MRRQHDHWRLIQANLSRLNCGISDEQIIDLTEESIDGVTRLAENGD